MAMQVIPDSRPLGAEIRGLNLAAGITATEAVQVRAALNEHSVIYFRHQKLAPQQQIEFTKHLGPLQARPEQAAHRLADYPDILVLSNILESGKQIGVIEAGQYWHSDIPYAPLPPAYSCLHAIEVPHDEQGNALGDTMFASTIRAYDTLSESVKRRIDGLRAFQTRDARVVSLQRKMQDTEFDRIPGREQPVVRTHPVTGKRCVYVNQTYTSHIVGMAKEESDELLEFLCEHVTREDVRYRHKWQVGDVLIWDDCAVQHHAVGDYALPRRRLMYRTTVEGTAPF